MWASLIGVAGLVVAALAHHQLGRRADDRRALGQRRQDAYSDYLQALSLSSHQTEVGDLGKAFRLAADAKTRIAVYGSKAVVAALADYIRAGETGTEGAELVHLCGAMRADLPAFEELSESEPLTASDLRCVLLGPSHD